MRTNTGQPIGHKTRRQPSNGNNREQNLASSIPYCGPFLWPQEGGDFSALSDGLIYFHQFKFFPDKVQQFARKYMYI